MVAIQLSLPLKVLKELPYVFTGIPVSWGKQIVVNVSACKELSDPPRLKADLSADSLSCLLKGSAL